MTRGATLHRLLCSLFAADELRRFILAGRDGDELALHLPGINVSLAQLADDIVAMLTGRGLIDHEFFGELERVRPRRVKEIRIVRTVWALEADAPVPGSPVVVPSPAFHGEIEPSAEYYALTLIADKEGRAVQETQTRWAGPVHGKPGVELREPSRIHPQRMIAIWSSVGQAPVAVVNNDSQFAWFFLHCGGNAIVRKDVLEKWAPSLFRAQESVQLGLGSGFSSGAAEVAASTQPTPPPVQRMDVFRRDDYHCRICGRTSEAPGAELDVAHIRSFDQGGPTLPWNLITLCKLCRAGISAPDQDHLHRKANDWRARLAGQTSL